MALPNLFPPMVFGSFLHRRRRVGTKGNKNVFFLGFELRLNANKTKTVYAIQETRVGVYCNNNKSTGAIRHSIRLWWAHTQKFDLEKKKIVGRYNIILLRLRYRRDGGAVNLRNVNGTVRHNIM